MLTLDVNRVTAKIKVEVVECDRLEFGARLAHLLLLALIGRGLLLLATRLLRGLVDGPHSGFI